MLEWYAVISDMELENLFETRDDILKKAKAAFSIQTSAPKYVRCVWHTIREKRGKNYTVTSFEIILWTKSDRNS